MCYHHRLTCLTSKSVALESSGPPCEQVHFLRMQTSAESSEQHSCEKQAPSLLDPHQAEGTVWKICRRPYWLCGGEATAGFFSGAWPMCH